MIKIGITGQSGFIGSHLKNFLTLKGNVEIISFDKTTFSDQNRLIEFVKKCDVIVHLAALNRHNDPDIIYQTNIALVDSLIKALETADATPHIIFSSSTQEEKDNTYGNSKKKGRELFREWAVRNSGVFTGLVIPNVFGPFGQPYYNSVIATFSHQLVNNETPTIHSDNTLNLIYVDELVKNIWEIIQNKQNSERLLIPPTAEKKVSEILQLLQNFKTVYYEKYTFPALKSSFEINLFNTFRSFFDHEKFFPVKLKMNSDERGVFVETVKEQSGGQFSYSTTHPGITRGNHFHTRKIERFIVIKGKASIELRRTGTDEILRFELDGNEPSFVDMPIWYSHNITNVGKEDLLTLFWINELYDPNDPDTFFEQV